jgi:branched-chain amino acid transport system substrate-binding protein
MKRIWAGCFILVGLLSAFSAKPSQSLHVLKTTPTPAVTPTLMAPAGEIKVAIMVPLSDYTAFLGKPAHDGIMLAINEWNKKYAKAGSKIVPIVIDSKCNGDTTIAEATKLIHEQNIQYIIGEICSVAAVPLSDVAEKAGVIQISPASSSANLTVDNNGNVKKFIFRACFIDPYQAQGMARYLIENKKQTAAILFDEDDTYSKSLADAFAEAFTGEGGNILTKEAGKTSDKDYYSVLQKIKDLKPDVIYLPMWSSQVNLIASQIQIAGIKSILAGPDSWDDKNMNIKLLDKAVYSSNFSSFNPRLGTAQFVKKYQAKLGKRPDTMAALGFDSASLLLASLEKAGGNDPMKVRDILEKIDYTGATGNIKFNDLHNPNKSVIILQFKGGQPTFAAEIEPK